MQQTAPWVILVLLFGGVACAGRGNSLPHVASGSQLSKGIFDHSSFQDPFSSAVPPGAVRTSHRSRWERCNKPTAVLLLLGGSMSIVTALAAGCLGFKRRKRPTGDGKGAPPVVLKPPSEPLPAAPPTSAAVTQRSHGAAQHPAVPPGPPLLSDQATADVDELQDLTTAQPEPLSVLSQLRLRHGPVEGLHIAGALGPGVLGRVYKASWLGSTVAVKVIEHSVRRKGSSKLGKARVLFTVLAHPNVVACYKAATIRLPSPPASPLPASRQSSKEFPPCLSDDEDDPDWVVSPISRRRSRRSGLPRGGQHAKQVVYVLDAQRASDTPPRGVEVLSSNDLVSHPSSAPLPGSLALAAGSSLYKGSAGGGATSAPGAPTQTWAPKGVEERAPPLLASVGAPLRSFMQGSSTLREALSEVVVGGQGATGSTVSRHTLCIAGQEGTAQRSAASVPPVVVSTHPPRRPLIPSIRTRSGSMDSVCPQGVTPTGGCTPSVDSTFPQPPSAPGPAPPLAPHPRPLCDSCGTAQQPPPPCLPVTPESVDTGVSPFELASRMSCSQEREREEGRVSGSGGRSPWGGWGGARGSAHGSFSRDSAECYRRSAAPAMEQQLHGRGGVEGEGDGCMEQPPPEVSPCLSLRPGNYEVWIVQEFCELGPLAECLKKRRLVRRRDGSHNTRCILDLLLDVAQGMEYLHQRGVVHGELRAGNVLLQPSHSDLRGYIAKVADFGLSGLMDTSQTHVHSRSMGTVGYLAPEVVMEGQLDKPADVYAFGMLMYEIWTCERIFPHMTAGQVFKTVVHQGQRPPVPADCPGRYASIMQSCWDDEPLNRPGFVMVVRELRALRKQMAWHEAQVQLDSVVSLKSEMKSMGREPSAALAL